MAPVNIETDHIRGSIDAPISIVEYGDYECPYTGIAYPIVKKIMKKFKATALPIPELPPVMNPTF
jgi:protein-disulfide isomerase